MTKKQKDFISDCEGARSFGHVQLKTKMASRNRNVAIPFPQQKAANQERMSCSFARGTASPAAGTAGTRAKHRLAFSFNSIT